MSRRSRQRIDKRDIALDLARFCGHGTPMPNDDRPHEEQPTEPLDPWGWKPQGPRTPIGPVDVKQPQA